MILNLKVSPFILEVYLGVVALFLNKNGLKLDYAGIWMVHLFESVQCSYFPVDGDLLELSPLLLTSQLNVTSPLKSKLL